MSDNTFIQPQKSNNKAPIILGVSVGLVIVLVMSYFGYNKDKDSPIISPIAKDQTEKPNNKTVMHPITGVMYTPQEAEKFINHRPLGVMVNNHVDARPQSGLDKADITYEIVAEGGITRFLTFFQTSIPDKVGPIRSTREYYLVLVKELGDAMLMHIGWSPQALEAIESWPVRSLGRGGAPFYRDPSRNVAVEHTAYSDGNSLIERGMELGWSGVSENFVSWKFKDSPEKYSSFPDATNIAIDFWYKGDYSSGFKYNPQNNSYLRFMGYDENDLLIPHIDNETKKQLEVKNFIVMYAVETPITGDTSGRLEYELIGSGNAVVFIDGKQIPATWSKVSRDERTMFYDENGNEIEFNRGPFWISIVPSRNIDQVVIN